ncbi:hypothetical protein [Bacillus sp. AFS017336]|uniref:hypothetical protein n=1 Tax=Bacillus sp. AFS017336 TaxID=2033489 RepID=UPI000BF1D1EA|nr:hypothetical protein [Bacillus sp. AFS017336]PEL14299.1 hypothetical protein CN601_01795 [Bacillus sp. AFS017336]
MKTPVSIFIMDVSNSSYDEVFGQELSMYLKEIVEMINEWTDGVVKTIVKHRMGDEILLVSNHYSSAYVLAFYISRIWKYKDNQPYFGLTFGDINLELDEIDIETWIHPLLKKARLANESLKRISNRPKFSFKLTDLNNENDLFEFEMMFNLLLTLQNTLIENQTEIQGIICSMYLIFMKQKKIASILDKTPATISSHFRKGNSGEILNTFEEIQLVLNSIQKRTNPKETQDLKTISNDLNIKIKSLISENIVELL